MRRDLAGGDAADTTAAQPGWAGGETLEFLKSQNALASCTSMSLEGELQVSAVAGFVKSASELERGQYVFAYNMRFTNLGSRRLRLLSRCYDFREGSGALASQIKPEQPEAAGVVGFTPLLEPGASFEFGSGVALKSPHGLLTGRFLLMEEPELKGSDKEVHAEMEKAELMLRLVYFKGLETTQFHAQLGELRFDADIPCFSVDWLEARRGLN